MILPENLPENIFSNSEISLQIKKSNDKIIASTEIDTISDLSVNDLFDLPLQDAIDIFEKQYILRSLKKCFGNVSKIAKLSKTSRKIIYRKIEHFGIDLNLYRI